MSNEAPKLNPEKLGIVCADVEHKMQHLSREERMFVLIVMATTYLKADGISKEDAKEIFDVAVDNAYRPKRSTKE